MYTAIIIILLSALVVLGDFFVKLSGQGPKMDVKMLAIGALIYASTALGWFYVMRHIKLSSLGVIFSLSTVLFLVLLGVFYFHEKLNPMEIIGIIAAIVAIILLSRFA